MPGCCEQSVGFDGSSPVFRRALWAVIAINATLFVVEMTAGVIGQSQTLKADALDFPGDTATYGLSLFVIGRPLGLARPRGAAQGVVAGLAGALGLGQHRLSGLDPGAARGRDHGRRGRPGACRQHRQRLDPAALSHRDSNVRSVWLCSRNDAIGNIAVLAAALRVWSSGTAWPDLDCMGSEIRGPEIDSMAAHC